MIVLAMVAVAWWMAAPDRFTASARTATGTAAKAAGTGARDHWRGGRQDRGLSRTARRDRWGGHAKGVTPKSWQRRLLKLEHAGVVAWKAVTGTGRLTRAAVRPVPGAVRDGWAKGQDRHRQRAGNRPAGLALDPPWWRPGTGPQDRSAGQVQDRPGTPDGTGQGQVVGTVPDGAPGQVQDGLEDRASDELLDEEDTIRARHGAAWWNRLFPDPLTDADRRFFTYRDGGYTGPLDQDGRPGDPDLWPFKDGTDSTDTTTEGDEMADIGGQWTLEQWDHWHRENARRDPRLFMPGTTPTPPGGTMRNPFGAELDDLTSVQEFAVHVADMAEESDFAALVEFCKNASDETRDFGADMGGDVAEFEEVAARIGDLLSELVDAATKVRDRSAELIGG